MPDSAASSPARSAGAGGPPKLDVVAISRSSLISGAHDESSPPVHDTSETWRRMIPIASLRRVQPDFDPAPPPYAEAIAAESRPGVRRLPFSDQPPRFQAWAPDRGSLIDLITLGVCRAAARFHTRAVAWRDGLRISRSRCPAAGRISGGPCDTSGRHTYCMRRRSRY